MVIPRELACVVEPLGDNILIVTKMMKRYSPANIQQTPSWSSCVRAARDLQGARDGEVRGVR